MIGIVPVFYSIAQFGENCSECSVFTFVLIRDSSRVDLRVLLAMYFIEINTIQNITDIQFETVLQKYILH